MCGDAGRQKESKGFIPKNYPICMLGSFGRMSVEDLDHVFSFDRHDVLLIKQTVSIRICCCYYFQKFNKKLSYCRATARRTMLVNSCYVLRGMGVGKVDLSNSKSDLQCHSKALAMVPFDRPHTISYWNSIATMFLSCTASDVIITTYFPKFKVT